MLAIEEKNNNKPTTKNIYTHKTEEEKTLPIKYEC